MNIINIILTIFLYIGSLNANLYSQDIDPKEAFFRYLRFHDGSQNTKHIESNQFDNIPQPGGFEKRKKRSYHVLPLSDLTDYIFMNKHITANKYLKRFKRNPSINSKIHYFRNKREPNEITKKVMMEQDLNEGREREARGVIKEQWIKQQYPVARSSIDDNIPLASFNNNDNNNNNDNIRAPRVHFVTQTDRHRQPELSVSPSTLSPSFREREGRSREHLYPIYQQQYPQSPLYYPQIPRARNLDPSYRPPRYYDPYFQHYDDRDWGRRYGYNMDPFVLHEQPQNKQRRIIYYATLPEVVRSPISNVHEQRYNANWRDQNIDTRYYRSQIQSQKHREQNVSSILDQSKTPLFPIQVSTDMNVRDLNKNPERRIFSEIDTRFIYKSPKDVNF